MKAACNTYESTKRNTKKGSFGGFEELIIWGIEGGPLFSNDSPLIKGIITLLKLAVRPWK